MVDGQDSQVTQRPREAQHVSTLNCVLVGHRHKGGMRNTNNTFLLPTWQLRSFCKKVNCNATIRETRGLVDSWMMCCSIPSPDFCSLALSRSLSAHFVWSSPERYPSHPPSVPDGPRYRFVPGTHTVLVHVYLCPSTPLFIHQPTPNRPFTSELRLEGSPFRHLPSGVGYKAHLSSTAVFLRRRPKRRRRIGRRIETGNFQRIPRNLLYPRNNV